MNSLSKSDRLSNACLAAVAFLAALHLGADRLGCSAGVEIVESVSVGR